MNESLARIAALEAQLGALIQSQDALSRHIDDTLKTIQVVSEARLNTLVSHDEFDKLLPIGAIVPFGGWFNYSDRLLECDGQKYPRVKFPKLYDAVSNFFGPGRGLFGAADPNFFYVPDLRFRVPVGVGDLKPEEEHPQRSDGVETKNATHTARQLGDKFGSEYITYRWSDYAKDVGRPALEDILTIKPNFFGANEYTITIPNKSWQPSLAIKYLIRAL